MVIEFRDITRSHASQADLTDSSTLQQKTHSIRNQSRVPCTTSKITKSMSIQSNLTFYIRYAGGVKDSVLSAFKSISKLNL